MKQKQKQATIKKVYKAIPGMFGDKEAEIYGKELDKIAEKKNGTLKPADVVEEARDVNSPLNEYFEWEDSEAAERWRIYQARQLINHIQITIKYDHTQKSQRAFLSVNETPAEADKNKVYVTIERVLNEPELRAQVIYKALKDAEYWQSRYNEYAELGRIFKAIGQTKKKLKKLLKEVENT
jgi:transcriptional regulator with PAS, ATPase and Fis domain